MLLTLDAEKFRNRNYAWLIYCVTFIFLLKNHVEKLGFFHNIRWAGWGGHESWLMTYDAQRMTMMPDKKYQSLFKTWGKNIRIIRCSCAISLNIGGNYNFTVATRGIFLQFFPKLMLRFSLSHLPYIDCCCHCSLVASETLTKITWTMA